MKLRNHVSKKNVVQTVLGIALVCGLMLSASAQGTWTTLTNPAPETIGLMLQLMDGRILAAGAANNTWYALTPDATGSYVNGTWSTLASMETIRLYYASKVLPNGDILICGGEYSGLFLDSNDTNLCERYHPQTNTWTRVPTPTYGMSFIDAFGITRTLGQRWPNIGDAASMMLPNGLVLLADYNTSTSALYDYTTNTWSPINSFKANGDILSGEENWTLLPDGSVLTVDCFSNPFPSNGSNYSQRYFPGAATWVSAANTPLGQSPGLVDRNSGEIGPGMLLYNGLTLFIGATTHTALYNYLTNTWVAGPDQYGDDKTMALGSEDGPGCVEINGKALLLVGPVGTIGNSYPTGQHFLEYTYSATANADGTYGSFIEVPPPADPDYDGVDSASYNGHFLQLPTGQILFANQDGFGLYVYTPQGGPNPAWRPKITGITPNWDGSYLLKGTQFNGLTEGAYYGDDAQMSSNYPLVRFTDSAKPAHVYYGRTYNPSTMGVATGNTPVSVTFRPPVALPPGTYSLQVVANGIASAAIKFIKR